MTGKLAILAGSGDLPAALAMAYEDAVCVVFDGVDAPMPRVDARHRFEAFGGFLDDLTARGVDRVVLAGGIGRPPLNPATFDPFMQKLAPRLLAALQGGDDALARLVIDVFEGAGIAVVGAHDLLPELTAAPGALVGAELSPQNRADCDRANDILRALSPLDVGQGAVVANGLALGIETQQGTDAMLHFVAATDASLRGKGGVLVKRPKAGQDLRVDMPAIGPDTVRAAAAAGLDGIVIAARQVVLIDRTGLIAAAQEAGIFVFADEG
ncbi:UDP-2,3-diacylglucosamine diphosphatase LpxI [Marinovum sp. 2_MG-2023]|uniref:LpxI family protein n=1 Tax=unclassified Marinovum TaxID=2647166 RepID=UPI0026E3C276|nr:MULTISPECIES: UDP-2,3-diacylglucosamine diphosphatase LpxI [unclassified Marinovum]MDO6732229.1 UDP-2,3-diacylglucosamine diphosphatase LpxI [Marinovum sp. 2_MG-2023]MDO6781551.1 UDP-2,3-diacylglucosamine diphosphatase LpxI [Marinovum sp. 1_MG-2023]